ncbi:calcium-binding protein [Gymnodinialimonas sp.]
MFSILPFLLVGLGLSFFIDNDDDNDEQPSTPEPGFETGDGPEEEDMLTFVQGIRLGVLTPDGDPTEGPLQGGEGDDTITGGIDNDVLIGAGGNDQIVGDLGEDTISGGLGNDTLDGGEGADVIEGGAGADQIIGGLGNDTLAGADGADTLLGGAGNDVLDGTQEDLFVPTSPTDPIDPIDPTIPGDDGPASEPDTPADPSEDPIVEPPAPPTGNQLLDGGAGNDLLTGDKADTLTGGEGVDSFVVDASGDPTDGSVLITDFDPVLEALTLNVDGLEVGDPTQDGFAFEIETRDLSDDSGMEVLLQGVVVATLAGVSETDEITISVVGANSGTANPGTFTNLGDGDDIATGVLSDDTINGGAGNDSIDGAAGRDVLNGDAGNDTLNGGAGRDDLSGGTGNDILDGGGNDEPIGATVVQERLDGGEGDDTLRSGDGFVALTGGEGTDVFEITRTELNADPAVDPVRVPVTEVTDLNVATEEVNISFVNGDASASPVPFTLVDAPDGSGVAVVIGGEFYVFLTGVLAADAPTVNVTSAAA